MLFLQMARIMDTAVARLYGFDYDFIKTTASLTDEMEQILKTKKLHINRGKHWTTDAGYHETWEQILNYRSKRALCLEMEGAGLFTIALYRLCLFLFFYSFINCFTEFLCLFLKDFSDWMTVVP